MTTSKPSVNAIDKLRGLIVKLGQNTLGKFSLSYKNQKTQKTMPFPPPKNIVPT